MLDLSWIELTFCGALAIIFIGPKDLPKFFKMGAKLIQKARRVVNDIKGSMHQLEREIDLTNTQSDRVSTNNWRDLLPDEVKFLPDDFTPGSMSKKQHEFYAEHVDKIRLQNVANTSQSNTSANNKQV